MSISLRDLLLIVPFCVGETFMLWALWNFFMASHRR
jgi:hypothetical protein